MLTEQQLKRNTLNNDLLNVPIPQTPPDILPAEAVGLVKASNNRLSCTRCTQKPFHSFQVKTIKGQTRMHAVTFHFLLALDWVTNPPLLRKGTESLDDVETFDGHRLCG